MMKAWKGISVSFQAIVGPRCWHLVYRCLEDFKSDHAYQTRGLLQGHEHFAFQVSVDLHLHFRSSSISDRRDPPASCDVAETGRDSWRWVLQKLHIQDRCQGKGQDTFSWPRGASRTSSLTMHIRHVAYCRDTSTQRIRYRGLRILYRLTSCQYNAVDINSPKWLNSVCIVDADVQ